jgi:WD40 repeat protein
MLIVLLAPLATASEVGFSKENSLEMQGLNIRAGEVSPGGSNILLVGDDGFVHMISASNPGERNNDQAIDSSRSARFNDVSWHPNGETALIAGDLGAALRYSLSDNRIEAVNGAGIVGSIELSSTAWRAGGDLAFFGAKNGNIYSFNEGEGMTQLVNTKSSQITDIACHPEQNICIVSSLNDGLAVIDRTREITWLDGTSDDTWVAVDCPDGDYIKCVGFASGRRHVSIVLDIQDASKSTTGKVMQLQEGTTDFISSSRGHDGTSLIHLAPMESVRYKLDIDEVFMHIESSKITSYDPEVAGQRIALMWEVGEDDGWLITNEGLIVDIYPTESRESLGILETVTFAAVAISVPGVILGLIFMNSPYLQRKYRQLRGFEKKE